jgi:hypothetical protein
LAARFDMAWATAWATDAPRFLAPCLGVGADWPVLDFDLHKWAAVCDHAARRPFVWIDDGARGDMGDAREHCQAPHLVIHADHRMA